MWMIFDRLCDPTMLSDRLPLVWQFVRTLLGHYECNFCLRVVARTLAHAFPSCQYEDPARQEKARALIPLDELEEKAAVALLKVRTSAAQPSFGLCA
jgi:hypothetical protein